MSMNDFYKGLTPEQAEKIRKCKTGEEILNLAKKENITLSVEQLEVIKSGCLPDASICPVCGNEETELRSRNGEFYYYCPNCKKEF